MEDPERNAAQRGWVCLPPRVILQVRPGDELPVSLSLTVYVPGGRYDYLTLSGKQHVERLSCDWTDTNTLSHIQVTLPVPVASFFKMSRRLTSCFLPPASERELGRRRRPSDQQCS